MNYRVEVSYANDKFRRTFNTYQKALEYYSLHREQKADVEMYDENNILQASDSDRNNPEYKDVRKDIAAAKQFFPSLRKK